MYLLECFCWLQARGRGLVNRNSATKGVIINPRRACAARVTVVVLSVCLSVCPREFSHYRLRGGQWVAPTGCEQREDRYNVAIFPKRLRSRDMAWKQAKKLTRAIHGAYVWAIHRACAYVGDTVCGRMWCHVVILVDTLDEQAVFEFLSSVSVDLCSQWTTNWARYVLSLTGSRWPRQYHEE